MTKTISLIMTAALALSVSSCAPWWHHDRGGYGGRPGYGHGGPGGPGGGGWR